jgi:hypothetical protein
MVSVDDKFDKEIVKYAPIGHVKLNIKHSSMFVGGVVMIGRDRPYCFA